MGAERDLRRVLGRSSVHLGMDPPYALPSHQLPCLSGQRTDSKAISSCSAPGEPGTVMPCFHSTPQGGAAGLAELCERVCSTSFLRSGCRDGGEQSLGWSTGVPALEGLGERRGGCSCLGAILTSPVPPTVTAQTGLCLSYRRLRQNAGLPGARHCSDLSHQAVWLPLQDPCRPGHVDALSPSTAVPGLEGRCLSESQF